MAKRHIPVLLEIRNDGAFTPETEREFGLFLQKALVLALKERNFLNDRQYARSEGQYSGGEEK